jgi:hypothetical protein
MAKFSQICSLMGEATVEFVYDDVTMKLEKIKTSVKDKQSDKKLRIFFGDIYNAEKTKDSKDEDFEIPEDKKPTYIKVVDVEGKKSIKVIDWWVTYGI